MCKRMGLVLLTIIFIICGILITASISLRIYAYNVNWYMSRFESLDINAHTGIDTKDLETITRKIINYLKEKEGDLEISVTVRNEYREVFNQREKSHMVDVRNLFSALNKITVAALLIFFLVFLVFYKFRLKKQMFISLILIGAIPITLLVILGIICLIDFNHAFNIFHEIFFSNDLWLLDPGKDILIQMLPQPFFESTALAWAITAWAVYVIFLITGVVFLKKMKIRK